MYNTTNGRNLFIFTLTIPNDVTFSIALVNALHNEFPILARN